MENMKKKFEVIESITLDKVMQKNVDVFAVGVETNTAYGGSALVFYSALGNFDEFFINRYTSGSELLRVWKYYIPVSPWCRLFRTALIPPTAYRYIIIKSLHDMNGHQFYRVDIDYKRFEKDYKLLKF